MTARLCYTRASMVRPTLPPAADLKLDLMFDGIRYTDALGRAAEHSFPNYFPHRFAPGEPDPTGTGRANIPYMIVTPDGMHCRIKTSPGSPWSIAGSRAEGWALRHDDGRPALAVDFEPAQPWLARETVDGVPGYQAGVTLHGDMVVVNLAPGCEYFLAPKQDGVSMRCTFCTYGSPDVRLKHLDQTMGQTAIPEGTYRRMQEVLARVLGETAVATIYLVSWIAGDKQDDVMFNIAVISVIGMMAMYSISIAALFKLRVSRPTMARPFRVPFYPFVPAFSLIGTLSALACMAWFYPKLMATFCALLAVGYICFRLMNDNFRKASVSVA